MVKLVLEKHIQWKDLLIKVLIPKKVLFQGLWRIYFSKLRIANNPRYLIEL